MQSSDEEDDGVNDSLKKKHLETKDGRDAKKGGLALGRERKKYGKKGGVGARS